MDDDTNWQRLGSIAAKIVETLRMRRAAAEGGYPTTAHASVNTLGDEDAIRDGLER